MSEFLMKPRIDFAFKEIMMDEQARIGFLSAMMKLNPKEMKETYILNTNLKKQYENEKLGILDMKILMNNDTEIDVKIHLAPINIWADQALFYLTKMYIEQINSSKDYAMFKKYVSISILDFELFKNEPEFYSCFHIGEDSRKFLYTDRIEFQVLELPKLPKKLKEDSSDIELWGKFINAERKEEFAMLAEKNTYIESAYRHLQLISQDDEKHIKYEARAKTIQDYKYSILEAEQRGELRGEDRGKITGREEGIERVNKLNTLLINDKRYQDLERSVSDIAFQQQLMLEYGI